VLPASGSFGIQERPIRAGRNRARAAREERIRARARVRPVRESGRAGMPAVIKFVRRAGRRAFGRFSAKSQPRSGRGG
jgi:hypothetical protein